ncbi:OmpA family protein [Falsirhodobacter algicola]|uniref:OmpA family protein n=1 Tax=Falsirhodobacter algicola TaxID=2692330 RepID=A0A8J8MTV4_9RHOB|nr:OmpA family protein [Falsirhodobacter algicola]QUS36632.1 OmpA family protein [Falsirhodobacter algicola]
MRLSRKIVLPVTFVGAAALAAGAATLATGAIETRSEAAVESRLTAEGITFAHAEADGLSVHLTGTAPDEATRFRALNVAGGAVDASRLRDDMTVLPARAVDAPEFGVRMLRNDADISLIGLVPTKADEAPLTDAAADLGGHLSDMLERADYPVPEHWDAAMEFALEALRLLPQSKISVAADRVEVMAIATSAEQKAALDAKLAGLAPDDVAVDVQISAPRPVLAPFALRAVKDADGTRMEVCSAEEEADRARILTAATAAGIDGTDCRLGLGAPSPRWTEAAEAALSALSGLEAGSVAISDTDASITGAKGADADAFAAAADRLRAALPDAFSLTATPPAPADLPQDTPVEFTAARGTDGQAHIAGRVGDEMAKSAVTTFAEAQFGAAQLDGEPLIDDAVPDGWTLRILAGLDALGQMNSGQMTLRPDLLHIEGVTGSKYLQDDLVRQLSAKLDGGFEVIATYDEDLDPTAALPAPQECVARIDALMQRQKISFAPGSADMEPGARATVDGIAEVLLDCSNLSFEIGGYTDSQGSEGGNQALSQARAEAVMIALQGRRVPVDRMTAVGYGEENPIADNGTEEGREANRRIEFRLTAVAPDPNAPPALQAVNLVEQIQQVIQPDEEMLSYPADQVDGSGDDEGEGEGDDDGAELDEEPSFAPTEQTRRPEPRPDDLN